MYKQDDIYKGREYQTQTNDDLGNIYTWMYIGYWYADYSSMTVLPHPQGQGSDFYQDLKLLWVYTSSEQNRAYNGNLSFVATKNEYQYISSDQGDTQYGNLTRSISYYYSGSAWVAYRGSRSQYYPNVSNDTPEDSRFLTGLPGYTNVYQCPGGCDWAAGDLVSSQWYLYDGNTMYSDLPSNGSLTGSRTMTDYYLGNPMYSDSSFTYDSWGNRTITTQYMDSTNLGGFGTGSNPQTTYTCYGAEGSLGGHTCSNDGYYTYPLWEYNALNQKTTYTYDFSKSVPLSISDPNDSPSNDTTIFATYDEFGRMVTIRRPGDSVNYPTAIMSYHEASTPFLNNPFWTEAKQRITGSTYFTIRKYYNGIGQLLQSQVVGATIGMQTRDILTDTFYDAGGRVSKQTVPYDVATGSNYHTRNSGIAHTETTYDILGRISTTLATDEAPTSYSYWDGYVSNVPYLYTQVTDPRNNITITRSDIWGRTIKVDPLTGPDVDYTYDAADRLHTTTRGGSVITLTYDFGGRKTDMDDPDMGVWHYAYDALGNLVRQTDAKGQSICLYYDLLNRLKGKNYRNDINCPADPGYPNYTSAYYYDEGGATAYEIGRRTSMVDISGSTTWDYDSRGRLIKETKAITGSGTFVTRWGYNSADLTTWIKYPANNSSGEGEQVNFSYLRQMLLDTVTGTNTYVYNTDYDAAGRVDLRKLGSNGLINQNYSYFDWEDWCGAGRLQQIKTGIDEPTSLQDLHYTYDENGNVLTIQDYKAGSPQIQTFTYDTLDRLSSAEAENGTDGDYPIQSYTYHGTTGNLESKAEVSYTYGDGNHEHAVTALSSGESYTYDDNGNQITRNVGGNSYTLSYDAENRLVSVSGAATATFVYDGDGNRVKGTIGPATTYIGNYFEWTGSTSTMKKYYYAGSTLVAMRTGSSTLNYLLGDHLGSQSITTNSTGSRTGEIRYYPWGTERYIYGTTPTTFHFTGQRLESGIGLYYYGARWYDPYLNRWIQPDTDVPESQDPQVLDRYIYAGNNPVKYTDQSGHCWGIASGLRGLPIYNITCQNLDMALSIVQNPNANFGEKLLAGGYIAVEATAHAGLVVGTTGLLCAATVPGCVKTVETALGIGTAACADGDCTNEINASSQVLQNAAQTAQSVTDKLTRYLLNPNHPRGSTMAIWYKNALGFTQENMGDLAKQIVFDPKTAYITEVTQFGTKYNQIISIMGANGKVIDIVAAWIELAGGTIKLVTTVPWK
ncbi:MAG: RHS repeat-associated core domain-containing protein [Anaerolineales bacterium]